MKFVSDPSQPLMRLIQNVTLAIHLRLRSYKAARARVFHYVAFTEWLGPGGVAHLPGFSITVGK